MREIWGGRADEAEAAVLARHVRRLWGLPGTTLGVVSWPATPGHRAFGRWHYWWQAHLLDCAVDAFARRPDRARRSRVVRLARTQRVRNLGRWRNDYYDDMAWLGLALQRADDVVGVRHPGGVQELVEELLGAWSPELGGIPWRRGDGFRNTPANGPAAILLARTGHLERAGETADWLRRLVDPATGLVLDGVQADGRLERAVYTYCQGVVLGAETELAVRTGEAVHAERVHALVGAVEQHLSTDGVLRTHGGGDGGLFSGILSRYLALVATTLPGTSAADEQARTTARRLVLTSARSVWAHRAVVDGRPLLGHDWARAAVVPGATGRGGAGAVRDGAVSGSPVPERDLSVQLSGWMLLESAARVCG